MVQEINPDAYLVEHYSTLPNLKSDFRNYNLFNLLAQLVKGRKVIDIGCGAAHLLSILKMAGKEVVGIEPSEGMRSMAVKINPGVAILAGMAEEVDALIKDKVDSVLMIDVLEHIEKDVEQVQKVFSVLKEEGEFILVVPAFPLLYGERDRKMGHYRRYTKKSLKKILTENGFNIQYLRYWNALGFLPYLISEKLLRRPLESKLRQGAKSGTFSSLFQRILNFWFKYFENNFDFGFGLSIICVARKATRI